MAEPQRKAVFVPPGGGAPIAWFGEVYQYLAVGEQTEGRFSLSSQVIPVEGSTGSRQLDRAYIGYYISSGELSATVGNRVLQLPAGSFLGVSPGQAQKFANTGQEPVHLYALAGPAGLDEFHFRSGVPLPVPTATAPSITSDDYEIRNAIATRYGIDVDPSESAWQADPRLRLTLPGEGKTVAVLGDLYRYLAVSDDTEGRYALFHVTVGPGNGPLWHTNAREDELFVVLRGEVTFQVDITSKTIAAGGVVHIPNGLRHRFENETDMPAEMLVLAAPGGLERLFDAVGRLWHDPTTLPDRPDHRELESLIAEAPKFGIELYC